jgi:glucosamine--fructose-6-phosphate aminotransferase (isomerizing)
MCAVVAFVGRAGPQWRQTRRILNELLLASASRGRDATGFCAARATAARTVVTVKSAVPADQFVAKTPAWSRLGPCSIVLAHTRHATHGDPRDNRNNHPFVSGDSRYALVHNGIVADFRELAQRHRLRLKSHCDSEVLLRLVERFDCPLSGLSVALRECRGSLAVAVYDRERHVVWLARNDRRPLAICKLRGVKGWFVSSTTELMTAALRPVLGQSVEAHIEVLLPLAAGMVAALRPDGSLVTAEDWSTQLSLF